MLAALAATVLLACMLAGCSAENGNTSSNADSANGGNSSTATESAPMAMANASDSFAASTNNATTDSTADSASSADTAKSSQASAAEVPAAAGTDASLQAEGDANQGFERKIVYKGNVTMEVKSYDTAQTRLRDLIHLSGGYLLNFSDQKTDAERGGTFTIKIPASGFDGFLSGLEKVEHVSYQSSAKGTDVTEEYVDLQARLKARQVVEARLLEFMGKATKTADLLQISNQLGDVQTEIEQIKGRIRYLDNNVAFSTIDLRLYEVIKPVQAADDTKQGFGKRITEAARSSTEVMYDFLQGLVIVIAGALPVLAVLAVIGIPSFVFYRNANRKRAAERLLALPKAPNLAAPVAEERAEASGEQTSPGLPTHEQRTHKQASREQPSKPGGEEGQ